MRIALCKIGQIAVFGQYGFVVYGLGGVLALTGNVGAMGGGGLTGAATAGFHREMIDGHVNKTFVARRDAAGLANEPEQQEQHHGNDRCGDGASCLATPEAVRRGRRSR